jgi:hypothetical protein
MGTSDVGSELIIRDCEINNFQIPYTSDSGILEIPGNFDPQTEYRIKIALYSQNGSYCAGLLQSSAIFTGIFTKPLSPPDAPDLTGVISGDRQLSISLIAPEYDGGSPITDYEYSTDNGSTWKSAGTTASTFVINKISSANTHLINGTNYQIKVRAINDVGGTKVGKGVASSMISKKPLTTPGLAVIDGASSGDRQLNFVIEGQFIITYYED